MACVNTLAAASGLVIVAVWLQGCGGGGGGGGGGHPDSPDGPAPARPMPPIRPLRAVAYHPVPCSSDMVEAGGRCAPDQKQPASDVVQEGYAAAWGPSGRDDLGTISRLGANAVRLYNTFGVESKHDHSKFLDRANTVGLHVIPGFHTQNVCPNFNCFDAWKSAALAAFKLGFKQDSKWHPAVAMVNLMNEPDALNFGGLPDPPVCPKGGDAKCRVRAALSALDGFLAAEKEAGIDASGVNITITWSAQQIDSIDHKVTNAIGYYGFQDMVAGTKDPSIADYTPQTAKEELLAAFQSRWTHGLNTHSDWDFVNEKVASSVNELFPTTPWFLGEYSGDPSKQGKDAILSALQKMDNLAKVGGVFLGATFSEFQLAYTIPNKIDGLFGLGNTSMGKTGDVCEEDVREHTPVCDQWDVYCLDTSAAPSGRANAVAEAWSGKVEGPGLCKGKHPAKVSQLVV